MTASIRLACLSIFSNGILYAWSSPFIVKITQDKDNYNITEDEASYFTFIPAISMMLTSFLFSKLCDVIGRKRTLLLCAIPHIITWILKALAKDVYMFYIARLFSGMGDACGFSALPMYIGEICSPKVRGRWGNALTFFLFLGQFVINVIGNFFSVKESCYICITIPVCFVILFSFMPESPYFYIMKGRLEEAKESLRRLRGDKNVNEDFIKLKADVQRQISESGTWKDLFTINSNKKALLAGLFLRTSQLLGGMSVFTVYTQYIFEKAGGNLSSGVSSMIYIGLCVVLNLICMHTVDIFGRKKSYWVSLIFCSLVLFFEAIYFIIDQFYPELDLSSLNWMPVAGMFLYIIFSSFGLAIIPTLMLGELFSASVKGKGLNLLSVAFALSQIAITNVFYFLSSRVGFFSPFLFFGICTTISSVITVYIVPETKGKTLEEIQQLLKGNTSNNNNETKQ
ncbi:facilitated trehalose transporter Tret1 isoform X2 [Anoplophora glabripennis]|uniref:facilitated trehalose transporter Tret1 isoform X2 n=1 Tax=Anoplophora glabripennis TaxID=217634 RepID=UPI0008748722|nr:facilitated trehalose transporter Tret1 isoform X2 [Anoplophora glabripennis]